MENFTAYNPTTLHFGRDVLSGLGQIIARYGRRVLLVYGKGSIKGNGVYETIISQLNSIDAEVYEYGGIRSNPVIEDVDAAAALGRENLVDVVLAAGGGSVIDSAKVISVAIPVEIPAWNFFNQKASARTAVPVITVLTLAATGSEMNAFAVMTNPEEEVKGSYGSMLLFPKHSFLDPQLTFSVPAKYTAYGIADIVAHALEAYFGEGESATLSDRFVFGIIKEAMEYGPALLNDLTNYELRAKMMFAANMALNGMTLWGRVSGEWGVHSIGHILTLLYEVPHGASLSIVYPAWLKLQRNRLRTRIAMLGQNLFETEDVDLTIKRIEGFFKLMDCPVRLSEAVGDRANAKEIYRVLVYNNAATFVHKLDHDDYRAIIDLMK